MKIYVRKRIFKHKFFFTEKLNDLMQKTVSTVMWKKEC